jgi:hypothetical protein
MFSHAAGTRVVVHKRILEEPAMPKARTLVGLDVHATKVVAAVLDVETGELQCFTMSGQTEKAAAFCEQLPGPVRVAYEAGPTGCGLARELQDLLGAPREGNGSGQGLGRKPAAWSRCSTRVVD